MESPFNRPAACDFIGKVIDEHHGYQQQGFCGWSLEMTIYDALVKAGYLVVGFEPPVTCPCPYDCDGCHEGDGVCWRGNPELWEEQEEYNGTI